MGIFNTFFKPDVKKLEATQNIEGLIKALSYKKDMSIRDAAIDALARIRSPEAVEGLIQTLKINDDLLCKQTIEALGKCKDTTTVNAIIRSVKFSENFTLWDSAIKSLGKIKGPEAVKALFMIMKRKSPRPKELRRAAVDALLQINDVIVEEGLIKALRDKDGGIRKEAERGLRKFLVASEVDNLILNAKKDISGKHQSDEIRLAEKAKHKLSKRVAKLIHTIENRDDYRQSDAIDELANLGALEAINAIEKGKLSRFSATEALNKIDNKKAAQIVREKLAIHCPESDSSMCLNDWVDMLIDLNDISAIPLLKKHLDRGDFAHLNWGHIAQFIEDHPEVNTTEEKKICLICHAELPVTKMKGTEDNWFCADKCWKKRGTVLPTGIGIDCPLFHEGLCYAGTGDSLCSLTQGYYSTDCHVYAGYQL